MKITREEFKELYTIYSNTMDLFTEYSEYMNENKLDGLFYPLYQWIAEKIGIYNSESEFDIFGDLKFFSHQYPVDWELEQVSEDEAEMRNIKYSGDLDKIYDAYIGGKYDVFNE